MVNWIINKFLLSWLKGVLDKLPLSGYKTVLGVVLAVLTALAPLIPIDEVRTLLAVVAEALKAVGVSDPASGSFEASIVLVIVGAVHKLLKWLEERNKQS